MDLACYIYSYRHRITVMNQRETMDLRGTWRAEGRGNYVNTVHTYEIKKSWSKSSQGSGKTKETVVKNKKNLLLS